MKRNICFLLISLFSTMPLFGQNWTGAVNADWNNAANWSATPGNGDDIEIDPANYTGAMADPVISGTSNFSPAEMLVQNGALLTISGTLTTSDRVEILGTGTIVTVTGLFALTGTGNNGRLIFAEGAHLQMDGGNLQVSQRLLFELGATGNINAGTVIVEETLALVDGNLAGPSRLFQNGGTITVNAEFGFENEAGEFYPAFEQTAGMLNINGALLWLGAAPGAGCGYFRSSGGTVNVSGAIGNDPTSTMGMHIRLSGSALLQHTASTVTTLSGDSIVLQNGARWFDINTVSWQNDGVFHATASLFKSGNTTLDGTGRYQFDTLTIPASRLLNHVSPAAIFVSGDIQVAGTFNPNSNQLILNGTSQQAVTATSAGLNLYDLEIANAANGPTDGGYGISLNNHLNIAHALVLTDGIVTVLPAAAIRLADNAIITGGTDTTFIDGYIEKTGDEAVEFPIGSTPDRYRPLSVSAPATTSTVIRVAYKFSPYNSLTPVETPLQSASGIEYWDLSRTGSTDLFSTSVGWNDAAQSGLTNCEDISLTVWDGAQWRFVASATTGLCDGDNAGTLNGSAALPAIGPVTIGFTEDVHQNQVTLCAGESLIVDTNTYTESGVYIDILEDLNGDDSTVVTILTVQDSFVITVTDNITHLVVSSPTATAYQWIDCNNQSAIITGETGTEFHPVANGSYAVIVSRNGCSDTSACVVIDQLGLADNWIEQIQLYPNPVARQGMLQITSPVELTGFEILSPDGRTMQVASFAPGNSGITVVLPELVSGSYWLKMKTSDETRFVKRFVVL